MKRKKPTTSKSALHIGGNGSPDILQQAHLKSSPFLQQSTLRIDSRTYLYAPPRRMVTRSSSSAVLTVVSKLRSLESERPPLKRARSNPEQDYFDKEYLASRLKTNAREEMVEKDAFSFLSKCGKADMDWTVANPVRDSIHPQLNFGSLDPKSFVQYQKVGGNDLLKSSATRRYQRQGIESTKENIIIGNGTFGILDNIYKLFKMPNSRQKVLMSTPTFGCFYTQCYDNGILTSLIAAKKENDFKIIPNELDQRLSSDPDIKIIVLNYPNNPTGKVMDETYAREMAGVLIKYPRVLIISDEVFSDMEFDSENKNFSLARIPELANRVIVLSSVGKSRGTAGIRVSFANFPQAIAKQYASSIGGIDYPNEYFQELVARTLEDTELNREFLAKSRAKYRSNIDNIDNNIELLNGHLNTIFNEEEDIRTLSSVDWLNTGQYVKSYIENIEAGNVYLLDFSGLKGHELFGKTLNTGLDIAEFLLEKAGIATVPGECSFIPAEDMTVRIVLSTPQEEINRGFIRIESALAEDELSNIIKLESVKQITRLDIDKDKELIDDLGLEFLLRSCSNLKELYLSNCCYLTDEDCDNIGDMKGLTMLDLKGCQNITNEALGNIAEQCQELKRINIEGIPNVSQEVKEYCKIINKRGIPSPSCSAPDSQPLMESPFNLDSMILPYG